MRAASNEYSLLSQLETKAFRRSVRPVREGFISLCTFSPSGILQEDWSKIYLKKRKKKEYPDCEAENTFLAKLKVLETNLILSLKEALTQQTFVRCAVSCSSRESWMRKVSANPTVNGHLYDSTKGTLGNS